MAAERPLRVAILWRQLAGYTSACFRALAAEGVDIHLVYREALDHVPYDDDYLSRDFAGHKWTDAPNPARLEREVQSFRPDALLVISWDVGAYRKLARSMRGDVLRILCMDNAWMATPKQWAGVAISRALIQPTYDVAFLPGERQAVFARRLGFDDDRILWGLYTCDHDAFASAAGTGGEDRRGFVFVGRMVAAKGVDVLAQAYARYRELTTDPWPLTVCGIGPLAPTLAAIAGVEFRGFVQPLDLPSVFTDVACLVLPSTWEPWGVVIHEATAAGLAVVCTAACGAATRLVLDGYNGVIVDPGNPEALAWAMTEISESDPRSIRTMSTRSQELSRQFTPQRWARYLVHGIKKHRRSMGLDQP